MLRLKTHRDSLAYHEQYDDDEHQVEPDVYRRQDVQCDFVDPQRIFGATFTSWWCSVDDRDEGVPDADTAENSHGTQYVLVLHGPQDVVQSVSIFTPITHNRR